MQVQKLNVVMYDVTPLMDFKKKRGGGRFKQGVNTSLTHMYYM